MIGFVIFVVPDVTGSVVYEASPIEYLARDISVEKIIRLLMT